MPAAVSAATDSAQLSVTFLNEYIMDADVCSDGYSVIVETCVSSYNHFEVNGGDILFVGEVDGAWRNSTWNTSRLNPFMCTW